MVETKMTNLAINESTISFVYEKSTARKEQFLSNGSIAKVLRSMISRFPISTIVPPSATILQDASKSSPTSELTMAFTPRPLVACMISWANFVFREENMRLRGML